jgi:predicted peptidase
MEHTIFDSKLFGLNALVFGKLQGSPRVYVYLHGSGEFGKDISSHYINPGFATVLKDDKINLKYPFVLPCCIAGEFWIPEQVKLLLDDIRKDNEIMSIDLIGYSRGGYGVYEYISQFSDIHTATVINSRIPESDTFITSIPLLIIHGRQDQNEHIETVRKFYKSLISKQYKVKMIELDGDHFIIEEVSKSEWLYHWIDSADI